VQNRRSVKVKAGPEISGRLKLLDFMTTDTWWW